jgi:hypothetical protein
MFDKESYSQRRKTGKRGQGDTEKTQFKIQEPTIIFINGKPTYANRAQRRHLSKVNHGKDTTKN